MKPTLSLLCVLTLLTLAACGGPADGPGTGGAGTADGNSQQQQQPPQSPDLGKTCSSGSECSTGLCFFKDGLEYGYCTQECEDFTHCPDLWSCSSVDNASSNYCTQ